MKTLFPVLAAVLALAACTASSPPAHGEAQFRRQCEQHFAKVADVMERGKKVKACVRARMAHRWFNPSNGGYQINSPVIDCFNLILCYLA